MKISRVFQKSHKVSAIDIASKKPSKSAKKAIAEAMKSAYKDQLAIFKKATMLRAS